MPHIWCSRARALKATSKLVSNRSLTFLRSHFDVNSGPKDGPFAETWLTMHFPRSDSIAQAAASTAAVGVTINWNKIERYHVPSALQFQSNQSCLPKLLSPLLVRTSKAEILEFSRLFKDHKIHFRGPHVMFYLELLTFSTQRKSSKKDSAVYNI